MTPAYLKLFSIHRIFLFSFSLSSISQSEPKPPYRYLNSSFASSFRTVSCTSRTSTFTSLFPN